MTAIIRISELDPVVEVTASDALPIVQDGSTQRTSPTQLRDFVHANPLPRNYYDLDDKFLGSVNTSGFIGDLNWRTGASVGGGTPATTFPEVAGRLGIVRLTSGATSGNDQRMYLTTTPDLGVINPDNVDYVSWVVSVPDITSVSVRLGLMSSLGSAVGNDGLFFQFDPSISSSWQAIARNGGSQSHETHTVVVAGNYYLLELVRFSGDWQVKINGNHVATLNTNIPSGTPLALGARVATATSAARSVDIDHMVVRAAHGQLYT